MDWSKVQVRDRWGQLAVYDEHWKLLDIEEIRELANALMTLIDRTSEKGSQQAVIDEAHIDYLRSMIRLASWQFSTPKRKWKNHAECVYFVRDPQNPSVTKVGFTTALSQRLRGLSSEYTSDYHELEVIAVAYTPHCKKLEEAIHHYLARFNTRGEWFMSDGVDGILKEIKQLIGQ